ncbi:MAG: Rrf2 family transcriptional regulator [Candidatus Tectomicrobia bacterium]|nr:Rrf2 family transcriptional regulator [Candidatus Tectomicrobia bacterium]
MKLNRESEYGIRALIFLARQGRERVLMASTVAQEQDLPQGFLAKIFQKLTRHGVLRSYRGKQRGYALARPPEEIALKEVVEAIEGPDLMDRCIFWSNRCPTSTPCLLHEWYKEIKPQFDQMLSQTTLAAVVQQEASLSALRPAIEPKQAG